ncbi:hypothetical protein [Aporhodopirellula aestuarii]|uniref:Uncharacterized protein n=1 Tax=Aporhodopirellula aestuarii TaxID=2950107 RepID=A0ABT0U4K8_9BACT|nr:hypothetical protein [Aporhodopirellula aestuarii]MCM2371855.1 hypothetical protein [Aporhodopirellula aestuarii]
MGRPRVLKRIEHRQWPTLSAACHPQHIASTTRQAQSEAQKVGDVLLQGNEAEVVGPPLAPA